MKKTVFLLLACWAMIAQASTYKFLVFTNTSGVTTSFSVNDLVLTVKGSELQVINANGTVDFALTDLASMQFAVDSTLTALENTLDADAPVQVFSVSGTSLGMYGSLMEAAQTLSAGTYVISNGSKTQTIVVK